MPRALISGSALASSTLTAGRRNSEPAEARSAFQFQGLTVFSPSSNPVPPKASAERAIVPRFPGSCRPAAITSSGGLGTQHILEGEPLHAHQRGYALRSLAGHGAGEDRIRQQQSFGVGRQLRQQLMGALAGRLAEENRR